MTTMNSSDFFNVAVGTSVIFLAIIGGYALWQLSLTLKTVESIARDIRDTTLDIRFVKNKMKYGFLGLITSLIGKKKGGETQDEF